MSCSTTYSDPPISGICLPQVSKYLGSLKLHLNTIELSYASYARFANMPSNRTLSQGMLLSTKFLYENVLLSQVSFNRFIYLTLSLFPQDPITP